MMNIDWWNAAWSDSKVYESLSEEQKTRLVEVEDFLGNNCLGWIKGSEKIRQALTEVLCRLPNEAGDVLLCNSDIVVIDGSTSCAWSWQYVCPTPNNILEKWLYIVAFRAALRDMPYKAVVGEVAHELAHVFLEHRLYEPEDSQEQADATARQWGFQEEIDFLNAQPRMV